MQQTQASDICIITVAKADEEHPRHSEASVIERNDGSLLMTWIEFLKSDKGSEDDAPAHLAAADSYDNGMTWQNKRVLIEVTDGELSVFSPSFLRVDQQTVLLFYHRYLQLGGGLTVKTDGVMHVSNDDGQTFGPGQNIWRDEALTLASNSVAIQLSSGRLVLPIDKQMGEVWTPTDHLVAGSYYSDDAGKTWQLSNNMVDLPMRGAMEVHVAECRDGRLIMVMRTQLGSIFASYSSDQGETWSLPQTTGLRSPEACPEIVRNPNNGDLIMTWNDAPYDPSFASHFGKRSPLTVAVSSDDGVTWHHRKNIETDPGWGYSNPAMRILNNGRVVLTYWATKYSPHWNMPGLIDLKAALFDLDWLYANV